ncbi:unnamed protein product [Prunus armeniaca]|uniref:Uncharacterized protein n=1 Tax=Prunus armeniaca TaxID=36596 RepID=A0A6J5UPL7_PRUAR|nr:unnamed protein product [Prunus armeniaca]CAB4308524.1 unnamed protein product [Prunus armeniaca]
MKNLIVCIDCHVSMKYISLIKNQEITVSFPLVLKVRKEAMNSLSGNGSEKGGMVATVDAANSTALEMFFTV